MNRKTRALLATVCAIGLLLVVLSAFQTPSWAAGLLGFWTLLSIVGGFFWVRNLDGNSTNNLGGPMRMSAVFALGPWPAVVVVFVSVFTGGVLNRNSWYKTLYNSCQLTLAGAASSLVWFLFDGPILGSVPLSPSGIGLVWLTRTLGNPLLILGFLLVGVAYWAVNLALMSLLFSASTGQPVRGVLRERLRDPTEVSSITTTLLTPLLIVLLVGSVGVVGIALYFAIVGLERINYLRYIALVGTQDNLVRAGRMAAMGEMSEEIGVTLGEHLGEMRTRAATLQRMSDDVGNESMARSVSVIQDNVDHMATLIEGITAFSHQETATAATDLNELAGKTIEFVRPQNRFDRIGIDFRPDPGLPPAQIDPGQIQQVLINLLANAADAMNEAGAESGRIGVATRYEPAKGRLVLEVTDTGPGIPPEHLARVFEPHFTTKETGHGFGLSTAFRIIENHQGSIRADTPPTGGARFEVELPAA